MYGGVCTRIELYLSGVVCRSGSRVRLGAYGLSHVNDVDFAFFFKLNYIFVRYEDFGM